MTEFLPLHIKKSIKPFDVKASRAFAANDIYFPLAELFYEFVIFLVHICEDPGRSDIAHRSNLESVGKTHKLKMPLKDGFHSQWDNQNTQGGNITRCSSSLSWLNHFKRNSNMIPPARKIILIFYMNHRIISTQIRQDFVIKEQNAQNQLSCSVEMSLMGNKAKGICSILWRSGL